MNIKCGDPQRQFEVLFAHHRPDPRGNWVWELAIGVLRRTHKVILHPSSSSSTFTRPHANNDQSFTHCHRLFLCSCWLRQRHQESSGNGERGQSYSQARRCRILFVDDIERRVGWLQSRWIVDSIDGVLEPEPEPAPEQVWQGIQRNTVGLRQRPKRQVWASFQKKWVLQERQVWQGIIQRKTVGLRQWQVRQVWASNKKGGVVRLLKQMVNDLASGE